MTHRTKHFTSLVTAALIAAFAIFAFAAAAAANAVVPPPPPPPGEIGSEPEVIAEDPPVDAPGTPGGSDSKPDQPAGSEPSVEAGPGSSPLPAADPANPATNKVAAATVRSRSLRLRVSCIGDGSVSVRSKGKRVGSATFVCTESSGVARVELSRKVARKLRTSVRATLKVSVSSGGQTATRAVRLRHGSLAVTAAAAGTDTWDYWFLRAITTPGDLGLAWVYYLMWDTETQAYWALVNKQDCTWQPTEGACRFHTATYYQYRYDYPNRRWLGAYGPYCFEGYACFDR